MELDKYVCIEGFDLFKKNKIYYFYQELNSSDSYIYEIYERKITKTDYDTYNIFPIYYIDNFDEYVEISKHFCTEKEYRKLKIQQLNGIMDI